MSRMLCSLEILAESSHAYAYWKTHASQFSRNFYFRGYSGWALRLAQIAFFLAGVRKNVKKLCNATTTAEQNRIWNKKLRPILLNRVMVRGFLGNSCVKLWANRRCSQLTSIAGFSTGTRSAYRRTR